MNDDIINILCSQNCSLVVKDAMGNISTYNKKGVRDLMWLIDNEPSRLKNADIADKIVGKAAAGLIANAGVRTVYASVMSKKALPTLQSANIPYSFSTLTEKITIPEGDSRCRLEELVENADTPAQIEHTLREHFKEMQNIKQ